MQYLFKFGSDREQVDKSKELSLTSLPNINLFLCFYNWFY